MSHQQIIDGLEKGATTIDRVTVYRILDWLVSEQLAHRVASESRAWHYGSIVDAEDHTDHAHAHFECRLCEKLYCIESSPPADSASLPSGFTLEQANVKFEGLCARCNKHSTTEK
jgi:Fur family ferric uptake transcriptional regulator